MALPFTLHAVYFLWDSHVKIVVLAVETGQTRCFITAEMAVAGFVLTGEDRHLVQNSSSPVFSLLLESSPHF